MAATSQEEPRETDKELRGNIRGLLTRAKHDKHNLISVENNSIVDLVKESNQLVEQVTRPRDQAVDAELFSLVTEAGLEYVGRLKQGGRAHTAGDFIRRLKTHFVADTDAQAAGADDPDAFNWAALGRLHSVAVLFHSVPVVHHMLGPMDAQPRQRRQIVRQAKRKLPTGEAERPEELANLQDEEKQETDKNMEEMWHVLRHVGGRVPLLDLVLNRASFAQTVENLFTLSFLVRDNKVALEKDDEEGMTVVQRVVKAGDPKDKSREGEKMQFVIPLDMETWEVWKQVTDESKPPLMKHRKELRNQRQEAQQQQRQQQQQQQDRSNSEEGQPSQRQHAQRQTQQQGGGGAAEEEEAPAEEDGDEAAPRRPRKRASTQPQEQQREQPAARRRSRGIENQEQQQQQQEGGAVVVKQEPRAASAAAAAANGRPEVISLISSEDEPDVTPQPSARAQATQAMRQAALLRSGDAQGSGPRRPSRGKR